MSFHGSFARSAGSLSSAVHLGEGSLTGSLDIAARSLNEASLTSSVSRPRNADGSLCKIDNRAVYGLYCSWALAGLLYGFVYNYINIPICEYVFGPMGHPGRSSVQQCNISQAITCLPWNFQVFYGFVLDRVSFFGTRRKGWIIFGWTTSLAMLAFTAFFAEKLARDGSLFTYMMLLFVMCLFYIFSTVSNDGMTIEFGKLEPPEQRGYIMTTGQMVRFGAQVVVNLIGILGMNDKFYYPAGAPTNSTIFPFGLSFTAVHLVLLGMCLPLYLAMVILLKDPPVVAEEHHTCKTVVSTLWSIMKTRVVFCLIVFCVSSTALASLQNPALNIIAYIASPSTFQISLGTLAGNLLFLLGVWMFRTFFINRNWRITFLWTAVLLAFTGGIQLMVIFNVGGFAQNGWFYAFGSNVMLLIQGVQQVLSSLAVMEVAPAGFEATVYEFLTSIANSGITLNSNLMNIFVPIFQLNGIEDKYHHEPGMQEHYNALMGSSTYFTIGTNIVGALLFCWFLPIGKEQCHKWLAQWRNPLLGAFNVTFGACVLFFSLTVSLLSAIPSTHCLQIAGGSGCH